MKLALVLAMLAHAAPLAHAADPKTGFVDKDRVFAVATEPVRLLGEVASDQQAKQREIDAAVEAFRRATPADGESLRRKASDLAKMDGDDLKKHADEARATLRQRLIDVLDRLRTEKHLAQIYAGPGLVMSPGVDLTDEAIKLMNAADAQGLAEENAQLKAAAKLAKKDTSPPETKAGHVEEAPTAPNRSPPAPPTRPPAPAAKK